MSEAETRPKRSTARPTRWWEWLVLLATLAVIVGILWPVLHRAREEAASSGCLDVVRNLGQAFRLYAEDNGMALPPGETWPERVLAYSAEMSIDPLLCPADRRQVRQRSGPYETSYTMNAALSGASLGQGGASSVTALLFDGLQVAGGKESADFRHTGPGRKRYLWVEKVGGGGRALERAEFDAVMARP